MQDSSSSCKEVAQCTDILWEILFRLPLKPLLRLKCVSKSWLTLISNKQFRESYSLHHHPRPTSLIFSKRNGSSITSILSFTATTPTLGILNLDFLGQSKVTVVCSCNGFLLCRSSYWDVVYFVCNPTNQDFTTLTWRNYSFRHKNFLFINLYLAFDPSISPHYKVIAVAECPSFNKWVFNEYSFKTRSWISPGVSFSYDTLLSLQSQTANGVYCNRAIHWCQKAEFSIYFDVDTMRIEHWRMPALSNSEWLNRNINYFGECAGRLYLIFKLVKPTWKYEIFEMNEDYSGWSMRHHIDLSMYAGLSMLGRIKIVRPVKEEKSILVLVAIEETLVLYDHVTSKKLWEIEMGGITAGNIKDIFRSGHEVFLYFENSDLVQACTDKANSTSRSLCCQIL